MSGLYSAAPWILAPAFLAALLTKLGRKRQQRSTSYKRCPACGSRRIDTGRYASLLHAGDIIELVRCKKCGGKSRQVHTLVITQRLG